MILPASKIWLLHQTDRYSYHCILFSFSKTVFFLKHNMTFTFTNIKEVCLKKNLIESRTLMSPVNTAILPLFSYKQLIELGINKGMSEIRSVVHRQSKKSSQTLNNMKKTDLNFCAKPNYLKQISIWSKAAVQYSLIKIWPSRRMPLAKRLLRWTFVTRTAVEPLTLPEKNRRKQFYWISAS